MKEIPSILRRIAEDRSEAKLLGAKLALSGQARGLQANRQAQPVATGSSGEGGFSFVKSLSAARDFAVIAEVKRASPSAGVLHPRPWDPVEIVSQYEAAGASAISVLTESRYFWGSSLDLAKVRESTKLPILRKDFLLDAEDLYESKALGADAVLLIVAMLEPQRLRELLELAQELALDALVEVHTLEEAQLALDSGGQLIGINNRDLKSFKVELQTSRELAEHLGGRAAFLVSESGLSKTSELRELAALGVGAFLVGSSLLRSEHPGEALRQLIGAR